MTKMLLFDVDLTLVATGGAGIRALNRAIEEVTGVPEAMSRVTPQGKTDPSIVREVWDKNSLGLSIDMKTVIDDILSRYVTYLQGEVDRSEGYTVLPGILELLPELDSRSDVRLGLATGNLERGARIKLERGGLNRYFGFGGYGSDAEDRAELVLQAAGRGNGGAAAVTPGDTFVIGDTPRDIEAGQRAGFRTVGVATGSFSVEVLEASGADLVIEDFVRGRDRFLGSTGIL